MSEDFSPQSNHYLLGQEEAENTFLQAWKNNTLHHAWILSGEKGVGKATLAYRIARFLLCADPNNKAKYSSLSVSPDNPIFQQVATSSHPDMMVLERDYTETDKRKIISSIRKGEVISDDELSSLKKSAFIRVDDVRKVNDFLSKTSFNNGWRVVIIDSADEMNKSAANALLKILEEPPAKTLLLLISHNSGLLLPTIRSRCAKLPLRLLNNEEVSCLLRRYRSELNETMISRLAEMSGGSIGRAILYADEGAVNFYDDMCRLLYSKQNYSLKEMLDFCDEATSSSEMFDLCEELMLKFLKDNMLNSKDKEELYDLWNETRKKFSDCSSVNMDKRLMLINLFNKICRVL
ncbi:MAG: DNA polymerase III subunit delta' [Alphaproteobacteria bacterium]|nr:DNA polymerase III subunit delta' [Alphaproteobacteria bacterium]